MLTVSINQAEFFAYHGFYPEEQILGSKFLVDVSVMFDPAAEMSDELSKTINYEQLYDILCDEMKVARKLIETVAAAIAANIKERFPFSKEVRVSLKKMNPPLKGQTEYTCAEVFYQF